MENNKQGTADVFIYWSAYIKVTVAIFGLYRKISYARRKYLAFKNLKVTNSGEQWSERFDERKNIVSRS